MNEDLISTIRNARFTPVFQQGYVMADVDELLERLVVQLSAGAPVREMIEAARFPLGRWTETYERYEVDLLLAQVKHHAEVREHGPEEAEVPPPPVALHIPQPRIEAVGEKKGLLARFFNA